MLTVSDTSPISNLARIGRLDLLKRQFVELWVPFAVATELARHPATESRDAIRDAMQDGWIRAGEARNRALVNILRPQLHVGEAEAIGLALEMRADRLLVDDYEGRLAAIQAGLNVTGVLGILLRSKQAGHIPAVGPEIVKLRQLARFYISPALEAHGLRLAGE